MCFFSTVAYPSGAGDFALARLLRVAHCDSDGVRILLAEDPTPADIVPMQRAHWAELRSASAGRLRRASGWRGPSGLVAHGSGNSSPPARRPWARQLDLEVQRDHGAREGRVDGARGGPGLRAGVRRPRTAIAAPTATGTNTAAPGTVRSSQQRPSAREGRERAARGRGALPVSGRRELHTDCVHER